MKLPKGRRRPRVGRIPYLIATPFTANWPNETGDFELITAPPRQLAHLAREDELDAACIPISDARSLSRRFEPLGDLCLAQVSTAPTALFASRIEAELLGKAKVGVSLQGAATVGLLELILTHRYGVENPEIVPLPPDPRDVGSVLFVGDDALKPEDNLPTGFIHHYNLVEEWHKWTELPFVFGVWLVRKTLSDVTKKKLYAYIDSSVQQTLKDPVGPVDLHLTEHDVPCPVEVGTDYIRACRFHVGDKEQESMDHFGRLIRDLNRRESTSWRDLLLDQ